MFWFIRFLAILFLMSVGRANGLEYPAKKTTKGYPTTTISLENTTPTTTTPPTCHGPNTTLANYRCQCQPVCGSATLCPTNCDSTLSPLTCVCAEQYVLDPHNPSRCMHASECQCKAPNEEFKTCLGCESTCEYLERDCTPFCGAYNSRCVCKEGYLRNENDVCVPRNSYECVMERTTLATPTTTTTAYRERIHCYNGTNYVGDCSWDTDKNSADYKKCAERQKEREKDAFQPVLCDQGVTECYDLRHNCHVSDVTKHVKGCGSIWRNDPFYGTCNELRWGWGDCGRGGDGNSYDCAACEGNLCNKGDIPRTTTTTYSTPSTDITATTTITEPKTPTTSSPPNCNGPNYTVSNDNCQCQPVCSSGTLCPSHCSQRGPPTCICAEQYVVDPLDLTRCIHASECPSCKAPNEVFKTCASCEPTCAVPTQNCSYCTAYNSNCVCKDGYLRDMEGICVPKNSHECTREDTTTSATTSTVPTTTTEYREQIHCYSGITFLADCSLYTDINSTDYKKCEEHQKQQENDAFQPIFCDLGVTQCYDLRHSCRISDEIKHMKGCGSIWNGSAGGICYQLNFNECRHGDYSTFKCAECESNLCNKGDLSQTTTTTYSTPPVYSTATTGGYSIPAIKTTSVRHSTTKATTTK